MNEQRVSFYNVGEGGYWGRLGRLILASIYHPAGIVTRHSCRQILKRRIAKLFRLATP